MKLQENYQTNWQKCPYCNRELDAVTEQSDVLPKEGYFSVCIECAGILMFEEGYFIKRVTNEDLNVLKMNTPEAYYKLKLYQKIIKRIQNDRSKT